MIKIYVLLFAVLMISKVFAGTYVAPDGKDSNNGSLKNPFKTISHALHIIQKGDTIFVQGGTYNLKTSIKIKGTLDGTKSLKYHLFNYKNEYVLLDFSGSNSYSAGLMLEGDYWHIRGINIKGAGGNGMRIMFGSDNVIENCSFFENRSTGLQLGAGASDNRIINCDSYYNADPPDYGDADGFASKLDVGTGNYFYGCRAWANSDDGWDGYLRRVSGVSTTLENCWAWGNGYLKDGTDPGKEANGNGFKMGGGDNSNVKLLMHHFKLVNCVAFNNKKKGFDQNNNTGSMTLINCTAYMNKSANYSIRTSINKGQKVIIKNCLSYKGSVELAAFVIQEKNSWLNSFHVDDTDFLSLNTNEASKSRKKDGSLPDISFLKLAKGSNLIDAGVILNYPYKGLAPDIGAFESDYSQIGKKTNK